MRSWQLASVLLLFTLAASSPAGEIVYGANIHQAQWRVSTSRFFCSLTQEVPLYGRAVFERRSGQDLSFHIEVLRQPHQVGVAKLLSEAPAWKHDTLSRDLGQVSYDVTQNPFRFNGILARRMLLELERGMFPTFQYQDWSDGRDDVQLSISAVNIRKPLAQFLGCLTNQSSRGFDYFKESQLPFDFDSSSLTPVAKRRLDEVTDYIFSDSEITGVHLCGHTDSKGSRRYNEALGRRRAASVRSYLADKGVTPGRYSITTSACGEHNPVTSNRTAAGRALNRVVKLSLIK